MSAQSENLIRVFLIDKHTLVRAGLRQLLATQCDFTIVGEADTPADALENIASENPDIILMELDNAQERGGVDLIRLLLDAATNARLILVTGVSDPAIHHRAAQFGAMGVVQKDQPAEVLFKAIAKVHAGEAWFDRMTLASVLTTLTRGRIDQDVDPESAKIKTLSDREREIVTLIGQGLKNKEIGGKLFISEITVRHHLTSIFSKLGVSDRLELIIYAYQNGLAQLPK